MVDFITTGDLIDAKYDAGTLEIAANGAANQMVLPRLGGSYHTLAYYLTELANVLADNTISANAKLAAFNTFINGLNITAQQKLDLINALVATGNTEITNLQSAINIAAAAGAGANGWTALVVQDASGKNQQELNTQQAIVNFDVYNTPEKYGASSIAADNTTALQDWLNSGKVLHLPPFKTYNFSGTLNLSVVDQSIIGLTHQKYGGSALRYTGAGSALRTNTNVGYVTFIGWALLSNPTTAGAVFDLGTIGIDAVYKMTLEATNWQIAGFETLIKFSADTTRVSFYNRFFACRFSDFKMGFDGIPSYNLNFYGCRFLQFTDAIRTTSGAGPVNIDHCSFERFNGAIHLSNNNKCEVSFKNNYVEIYDTIALPTNFTKATNQTKGNYFGGNVLFVGYYSILKLESNKLSIGGVYRIGNCIACDYLRSVGNGISLYETGNNLGHLYLSSGTYKSVEINDINNGALVGDGSYVRTYATASFNTLTPLRSKFYYYDCIVDKVFDVPARIKSYPTLENSWVIVKTQGSTTVQALVRVDGTTVIYGVVNGVSKTSDVILIIPTTHAPSERTTTLTYVLIPTKTALGADVMLKYDYTNGELSIVGTPTSLVNILINVVIPQRI